jgi:hypothetical protein
MSKWEELETAARAATPGPWGHEEIDPTEPEWGASEVFTEGSDNYVATHVCSVKDAAYIAAANPSAILELLAERDALAAKVNEMIDSECDKIMAMSDNQISAMLRQDGRNPDDVATIGKQAAQLAVNAVKLSQLEAERDEIQAENLENCRLLGMSAERELKLIAERDALKKELDRIKALEPVAWISEDQTVGPTYGKKRYDAVPIQSLNPLTYKHTPLYTLEKP